MTAISNPNQAHAAFHENIDARQHPSSDRTRKPETVTDAFGRKSVIAQLPNGGVRVSKSRDVPPRRSEGATAVSDGSSMESQITEITTAEDRFSNDGLAALRHAGIRASMKGHPYWDAQYAKLNYNMNPSDDNLSKFQSAEGHLYDCVHWALRDPASGKGFRPDLSKEDRDRLTKDSQAVNSAGQLEDSNGSRYQLPRE
jgi:hypothetical protein